MPKYLVIHDPFTRRVLIVELHEHPQGRDPDGHVVAICDDPWTARRIAERLSRA